MKTKSLQELIEERVPLGRESATGFRAVRCAACNDHSERAGFKFGGDETGYSCFNCGRKARHTAGKRLSRAFREVLAAFGLSDSAMDEVTAGAFFLQEAVPREITLDGLRPKLRLHTPEVALPPHSHPLGAPLHDDLQAPLVEYLHGRGLDPLALQAHFSLDPKYLRHVILPCMRDGRVIFWQARHIDPDARPRYRSPSVDRSAVLWGYDELWRDPDLPLFVNEGILNAASVAGGVALLGSTLNDSKIEVLNRCRRRKVVVVERDANGASLARLALTLGWEVTFPPDGVSDANESLQRYGRLYTTWTLMRNRTVPAGLSTAEGVTLQSKLALEMGLALAKRGGR